MSNVPQILLVVVVLLWAGLGAWRLIGARQMQDIEQRYRAYYAEHVGETPPPPMRWDYERWDLVPIPADEITEVEGSGGPNYTIVQEGHGDHFPVFAYGIIIARIPSSWFHGAFAAASVILALIALRIRLP